MEFLTYPCRYIAKRYVIVLLCFLAGAVGYFCRVVQNFAIKGICPRNEIYDDDLTSDSYDSYPDTPFECTKINEGIVLESFYWGYVISQIPSGIVADYLGAKWILGIGTLIFSVSTAVIPICTEKGGISALMSLRILGGLANGVMYPCFGSLLARWAPADERTLMYNIAAGGAFVGSLVGGIGSATMISHFGWRLPYYVWGGIGVIWFILWVFLAYSSPATHPYITLNEMNYLMNHTVAHKEFYMTTPWLDIFKNKACWGIIIGEFGHGWAFFLISMDFPTYINDILRYDMITGGVIYSVPYIFLWIACLLSGALCDWQIRNHKYSRKFARQLYSTLGAIPPAIFIIMAGYFPRQRALCVSLIAVALCFKAGSYTGLRTNILDICPNYAGAFMGLCNFAGSITAVFVPSLNRTFLTKDRNIASEWVGPFWVCFVVLFLTNTIYIWLASGDVQPFNTKAHKQRT